MSESEAQNTTHRAETGQLKVAAVGDLTILDRVSTRSEGGFLRVKNIINEADIAYGHVEGVIAGDEGYPAHDTGVHVKLHPAAADEIRWLGIHMVSNAGNHSMDYAVGGLLATNSSLDRAGVAHSGTGRNLAEARAATYVASPKGRVALISATSYFSPWAAAGNQRRDCTGRPGISPIRYETRYVVDARALRDLRRISDMLGFEDAKARKAQFGMFWGEVPDTESEFHFLTTDFVATTYNKFVSGDKPGIDTVANRSDAEAILRSIRDAREQADWVFVALHSHEADGERTRPARFMRPFALECVDAGADAVLGTGPHILRGIEIYKRKPIFYCLGNFIEQFELVRSYPADFYERYGLNPEYTPVQAWMEFTKNDTSGFVLDRDFWQSVCVSFSLASDGVRQIELHPLTLGFGKHRARRGLPLVAEGDEARSIIERLRDLSAAYGTEIRFKDGIGVVEL